MYGVSSRFTTNPGALRQGRGSLPILVGNVQVGYASTSSWSPLLKKYIALAHLQKPYYEIGTDVRMEITVEHHRQHAPAKVVKLPFYEPEWKKNNYRK
jgi:aminomethyltransferase